MKETKVNTLDLLVQHSLKQHIDMVELLRPLQRQLETTSLDTVTQFNVIYSAFQKEIKITDNRLVTQLNLETVPDYITQLLDQRQTLQKEILHILRQTVLKASSVKSLMASEIQSVKNGRKALGGYKIQAGHQGRIVNRTS